MLILRLTLGVSCKDPDFPKQNELDDLTRDLGLTNAKAEILSSRLKK